MPHTANENLNEGVDLLGKRLSLDIRQLRRRCMVDPAFRALCEDYFLACRSRKRLQDNVGAGGSAVLAEYELVIAELESEAAAALQGRRDHGA